MTNISTQKGHRIITKWIQPYVILEYAKKYFDVVDYTFSGLNKFEIMDTFLDEIKKKDSIRLGLYMKNVNKFYLLSLKQDQSENTDIDAIENLLLKNKFGSNDIQVEDWYEITTDTEKAFNLIDLGKAEAAFIMDLEE